MDVRAILELKGDFVLTIGPEATILDASRLLHENYIGAVVVVDETGRIAGILSERDIAVSLPQFGPALGETRVDAIMTRRVVSCAADMTVPEVLDIMVSNGIRHLPVVDGARLVGVISLRDVVGNWVGTFLTGKAGADVTAADDVLPDMREVEASANAVASVLARRRTV